MLCYRLESNQSHNFAAPYLSLPLRDRPALHSSISVTQSCEESFDLAFSIPLFLFDPFLFHLLFRLSSGSVNGMRVYVEPLRLSFQSTRKYFYEFHAAWGKDISNQTWTKLSILCIILLLLNLSFWKWRHGICFLAGCTNWIPTDRSWLRIKLGYPTKMT